MSSARFEPAGPLRGSAGAAARQVDLAPRGADRRDGGGRRAGSSDYLDAADTRSTLDAVRALGAAVDAEPDGERIAERRGSAASGCAARARRGERSTSATRARCCGSFPAGSRGRAAGEWTLDGDESIRRRPVDRIAEPLRLMGATVECRDERLPPLRVEGADLRGDLVRAAGGERAGEVVRAARRAARRR